MNKKKIINILIQFSIFALSLVLFLVARLTAPATDLDEVWNYNTANAFAMGLIPYKQVSMITTPLLPMINSIFLKIVFNGIITYRVLMGIVFALIVLFIYLIIRELSSKKLLSYICAFFIGTLLINKFLLDYNYLFLLIVLMIAFLEVRDLKKNENFNFNHNLCVGLLTGLAFLTKQTIGLLLIIVVIFEVFIYMKKIGFDLKFTKFIKLIGVRIFGMMIPITIFLIYLGVNGAFNDFINYAIKGVKEFSNSIPYYRLFDSNDKVVSIISRLFIIVYIPLFITFILECVKNKKMKDELMNIYVLAICSIPVIAIIYPISDDFHLIVASVFALTVVAYLLIFLLNEIDKFVKIDVFYKKLLLIGLLFIIILISFKNAIIERNLNIKENVLVSFKHYEGIYVPKYLSNRISDVTDKVRLYSNSGRESIIIDAEAAIYDIVLNKYKKNYDMLLIGNIGERGVEKIINEIKDSHNVYYFVKNPQYALNWQLPEDIIDYIRNNLKYHETVSVFDVYYKD
ncbi:MAG: glycosyltransferase family 39 protein [Clostridiales bacterium]|jgi:membrane protein|nr:glycosyltransferase family 39 protein [Clostridiales bacterium]